MLTPVCQRWRARRDSYRPAGEEIDPRAYEVAAIAQDGPARAFVEANHYSGTFPAARFRFGLYERGALVGVAVFSVPMRPEVLRPLPPDQAVELGRFVLLDRVPANGESWFLARCLEQLRRRGLAGVVSFSDPEARTSAAGAVLFGGHLGTVYQASNALYLGRATPRTLRLLPDGRVLSERALSKIRGLECGWRYAVDQLVSAGAPAPSEFGGNALRSWLRWVIPQVTRRRRHGGNHKYVLPLDRAARRLCPDPLPYPKVLGPAGAGLALPGLAPVPGSAVSGA